MSALNSFRTLYTYHHYLRYKFSYYLFVLINIDQFRIIVPLLYSYLTDINYYASQFKQITRSNDNNDEFLHEFTSVGKQTFELPRPLPSATQIIQMMISL